MVFGGRRSPRCACVSSGGARNPHAGWCLVDRGATLGGFSVAGILRDVRGGAELAQLSSAGQLGIDGQAVAVVHQHGADETELARLTAALRNSRASLSAVERCVSFERFSRLQIDIAEQAARANLATPYRYLMTSKSSPFSAIC